MSWKDSNFPTSLIKPHKKVFMKHLFILFVFSLIGTAAQAGELAESCASLQVQLGSMGSKGEQMMRDLGMGELIDMCSQEDTGSYKEKMASGTLYCKSGDLCGEYDFEYDSDRKKYLAGCSQVASCPGNYSDKCSLNNDKVRNGRGTVDWTIYAYNGLVRDSAANLKCN
jgi:hypothetical protein